jgi:mannose-1-phosphate guanylyltransferase/mannose-6-phosphate isomerase
VPDLFSRPIVLTAAEFRFIVAEQIRACAAEADIILEPARRDSGPAIAAAAELVARRDPKSILLVLAADHLIAKPEEFVAACRAAQAGAESGRIVTFGIVPTHPATSYGYIRRGPKIDESGLYGVARFVEKPDAETAARYIADGYLWNSGNFMFRADAMRAEVAKFEPEMAKSVAASIDDASRDLDFVRLAERSFCEAPRKSIDYAVMEKTSLAAVVPSDFGWSDVGSWDAVWELQPRDEHSNATEGPVELIDAHGSLVRSDGVLTTVIGCRDIVVIVMSDAVLVVPRNQAERVKALVDRLKAGQRREATDHCRSYRPWGYYQSVDNGDRYQVKRIVVEPGHKLSLQKHFHRAEHWVVVKGTAEVTIGDQVQTVHENESIYVRIGSVHRLANPGKIPLELIEVQVGSYLGEDDIVRLEDVYRRE